MHSLRQRQGNRQKHALMRNELCYLCYLPPQLGPARHNNVVATIDAFPQFTELMEWVSNSVTYFCIPLPSARTHKHKHPPHTFPRGIQSKAIIWVMRKVKNIKGQSCLWMCGEETLLCHYAAWQLLFAVMKLVLCHKAYHSQEKRGIT